TTDNVAVFKDGVALVDGIDYSYSYNSTSDTIVVTPLSGIWERDSVYVIRVNNRDYYRTVAKPGWELPDGSRFLVRDGSGAQETFEFESGYTIQVPQTLRIIIPEEGGSLGGVRDGETFTIRRVSGTTVLQTEVFEFDSNGVFIDNNRDGQPDNHVITFSVADGADAIAGQMVTQLFNADLDLRPVNIGDGVVHLGAGPEHRVDVARARSLTVSPPDNPPPVGIQDGDFFTIDDGSKIVTFEFDSDGLPADADMDGIADHPNASVISFHPGLINDQIAERIVTAVELANVNLTPAAVGDGMVHLGGVANVHIVDVSGSNLALFGAPGVRSAFGIRVPTVAGEPRFAPDALGTPYLDDGNTFSIGDGTSTITFELDDVADPRNGGKTVAPNIVVAFYSTDFGLRIPTNVDGSPRVAPDGTSEPYIRDGDTFTLTDGVRQVKFELDNLDASVGGGATTSPNIPIHYRSLTDTTDDIANAIVTAIAGSAIQGLNNLRNAGDGVVLFGEPADGSSRHALNMSLTGLEQTGQAGVRASTVDDIANVLVAAIQNAPLSGLNPTNAGNGIVLLGEATDGSSSHVMDLSQTGLSQVGSAGTPAAIPVYVTPVRDFDESGTNNDFDGTQVAVAIIDAVNGSSLDVHAIPAGADAVEIDGAAAVIEVNSVFVSNKRFVGVKDLAGNSLKPNLLSGDTQMSIVLGQAAMDFGDAPQTSAGDYPTQLGQNGAFHMITDNPLFLGTRVDADPDGLIHHPDTLPAGVSPAEAQGDDYDAEGFSVDTSGAANVHIEDATGSIVDVDVTPTIITLDMPLTLAVSSGAVLTDGAQFRVTNNGRTVSFEFDSDGSFIDSDGDGSPDNPLIRFVSTDSAEDIALAAANTVRAQTALKLAPVVLGGTSAETLVHIGGQNLTTFGVGVDRLGRADFVSDGETFRIDVPATASRAAASYVFEFEDTVEDDGVALNHIPVRYNVGTTQDGLAQSVIQAVLGTNLGIAATDMGEGRVELSGRDDDGVVMGAFNPYTVTQIQVFPSAQGLLDAWIDFNIDGDFNDPGEQILASRQIRPDGDNVFEIQP
ncbi:MAG: hypothetical protein JJ992_23765, partial [Planctomycetes bacterium]|nr:hypothetical protein [Planctomycetota bacterium]